jgi:sugar lactone lactonase YvrE
VKTVSRAIASSWLVSLALGAAPALVHAQSVVLVHEGTIYADANDVALKAPEGVACTDSGHLVVADTGNQRLLLYTFQDGRLRGGNEVKLAQLTAPLRVQIAANGEVFALDWKTRKIVRVAADGSFGGTVEPTGVKGPPVVTPASFKLDASGNTIYVLDGKEHRVLVLERTGAARAEVPLPREGIFTDVAVDAGGTIYAVDAVNAVIWAAEKGAPAFKALTQGMKDRMSFPSYLTASKGKLFVVDQNGNGVVILGIDGSYQGRQLSIGWSEGLVNYPAQLCLTDAGAVFLADRFNNRVQTFSIPK